MAASVSFFLIYLPPFGVVQSQQPESGTQSSHIQGSQLHPELEHSVKAALRAAIFGRWAPMEMVFFLYLFALKKLTYSAGNYNCIQY